ncbi:hypothetical protein K7432_002965 [Basidiobolus ranarum]|uniref:Uncharacterized protein n=1 Tax=Basidiobolus ranarum TaxID=34480 RepID=A0ABR2W7G6_9FUNG
MSCLALVPPALPDFRSDKMYNRLSSTSVKTNHEKVDLTDILYGSPYSQMENTSSGFFDTTHITLYEGQSFTLFEDHILIHNQHFPIERVQRIEYRNILDVSTDEGLTLSWHDLKTGGLTLNSIRRSPVLVLTIRNKHRKLKKVGFSLMDTAAYSLLKRLVYEANHTPLIID